MKKYYLSIRALHLYFGLLISPFILIFSVSVLVLNHPEYFDKFKPFEKKDPVHAHLVNFKLQTSDSLNAKFIIQQLGIHGEIDWISKTDSTISFPVNKPGLSHYITVYVKTGEALITERTEGFFKGTTYLHTMPGQHNAKMRGNSVFMKAWRVATDVLVYSILFVSATGVFLWFFLRPERKLGIFSFSLGLALLIVFIFLLF